MKAAAGDMGWEAEWRVRCVCEFGVSGGWAATPMWLGGCVCRVGRWKGARMQVWCWQWCVAEPMCGWPTRHPLAPPPCLTQAGGGLIVLGGNVTLTHGSRVAGCYASGSGQPVRRMRFQWWRRVGVRVKAAAGDMG